MSSDDREVARVAKLTDAQVLVQSDNGRMGPGIIGKPLYDRAQEILKRTGGGVLGPAISDPDYAKKQAAARKATSPKAPKLAVSAPSATVPDGDVDPANLSDPRNPWTYVTLSGAKMLAQQSEVSYVPKIKRADLIAELQKKGVTPPPVPEPEGGDAE